EVDCRGIDLRVKDTFLLTTDGVHDFVDHDLMCEIVSEETPVAERAQKIVEKALANKTPDNVTALIFEVESLPEETEEEVFQKLTRLPFPPDLQPGMIIDGFKILQTIAESARGQVYLAEDSANQTKIVLKTPSVNYEDDPTYLNGFIQEQWVGQRINHPGVMKPYISGRHRTCLYFKTEYIEGQNLKEWIQENSEPLLSEVRPIVEQIIQALRAFHRQDMVHQDLKPDNIMIDTSGRVKIIDFGSTKVAGITEITSVINPDHPMGTLNYTAPEYMMGEQGTNRSDIFSLGVIVYEMLTGHLPYKEKNINSFKLRSYSDMKYIPARKWRLDIPEWVDAALKKAVAPNPADRYGLLSEFLYDFKTPKRDVNGADFQPLLQRNPLLVWQGIAAGCFVLWLATLWWFLLRS
ncbi:MAG TPA: bifunctional protein-serine/threonine kinase/phosphatase, partial [Gammaproteobacteria bacterium]|nr:bifunctional protein-serine/threonine kinase/phosphatase [Gammaproteobacteria bacterium]